MSTSLKVVSEAAVFWDSLRRSAIRKRIRFILTYILLAGVCAHVREGGETLRSSRAPGVGAGVEGRGFSAGLGLGVGFAGSEDGADSFFGGSDGAGCFDPFSSGGGFLGSLGSELGLASTIVRLEQIESM